uniref:Uncharacterized protein n=1 Tax=Knipowitschia caucasica TaxID=637954 RepID=A0AAV2LAL3_KNICA
MTTQEVKDADLTGGRSQGDSALDFGSPYVIDPWVLSGGPALSVSISSQLVRSRRSFTPRQRASHCQT